MTKAFAWAGRSGPPIGVEIGGSVLRMVQLDSSRSDSIRRAVAIPLDEGRIDVARLRKGLRGFRGRDVVVSPSRTALSVRPARLPMLQGEELREAARWEAAAQLGSDGADLVAEPIVVARTAGDDGRLEMLLVAGSASGLEAELSPLLEAGLRPIAVEPAFLGSGRAHAMRSRRDSERETVRIVVDVGAEDSWIVVMRGDGVVFAKQVEAGGRRFDEEIARDLGIGIEDAGRSRLDAARGRVDGLVRGAVAEAVRRTASGLAEEISMAVRYATVSARLSRPVALHLCGEAGDAPGLDEAIGRAVPGTDMKREDTLAGRLATIAEATLDAGGTLAWATVLGLALRPAMVEEEAA